MPDRFGAYEILHELTTGGMGAVLLGRRRGPGAFEQLVAIKTIRPEYAQAAAVRAMFLDEAAILARLSHPAVATVHDFGEQGGTLYMVMEYVAGIALRDAMAPGMPPVIAARAIAEACRGVHAAHELRDLTGDLLGVVHRDISPDNLMVGFDGHVKVIDFGIALIKNRQAPVTELGTLKGKPPYMSPEQVKNEAIDRRSDVFSLAVVLWELLTGRRLFAGDSIYAIALAVEEQELQPPSHVLGAPLPLGLDAAVMTALDRDRSRRTPTAAAFAEQLEQVIQIAGDETLEAWAERALDEPRTRHRAWLAGVVAGEGAPRPIGRATGEVTALSPSVGKLPTAIAPIAPIAAGAPPPDPSAPLHLAARSDDMPVSEADPPRRRRRALPVLLALAVLAVVAGGSYLARRPEAPPARIDGGIAALPADVADAPGAPIEVPMVPADAPEMPIDAPIDAPAEVPIDAGHRRPIRHPLDAGHIAPRAADAAIVAAPPGFGTLIVKPGDRYLNVVVDGQMIGPTPIWKRPIPTGTHTIELVDPRTTETVVKRTIRVDAGKTMILEP